jgi:hypothetical protein
MRVIVIAVAMAGCVESVPTYSETSDALWGFEAKKWPRRPINVCFEGNNQARDMEWVQEFVEASWGSEAGVSFKFTHTPCARVRGERDIRVALTPQPASCGGVTGGDSSQYGTDLDDLPSGLKVSACPQSKDDVKELLRGNTVHEFGHALGFIHEELRSDKPVAEAECGLLHVFEGTYLSRYDNNSVMNYCADARQNGYLSHLDIEGSHNWYAAAFPISAVSANATDSGFFARLSPAGNIIYQPMPTFGHIPITPPLVNLGAPPSVAGTPFAAASAPAGASWGTDRFGVKGRLDVIVLTKQGTIAHRSRPSTTAVWTPWADLGAPPSANPPGFEGSLTGQPVLVARAPGLLTVLSGYLDREPLPPIEGQEQLYRYKSKLAIVEYNGQWTSWRLLPASSVGRLATAIDRAGALHVFSHTRAGNLDWIRSAASGSWPACPPVGACSIWTTLAKDLATSPTAMQFRNDTGLVDVMVGYRDVTKKGRLAFLRYQQSVPGGPASWGTVYSPACTSTIGSPVGVASESGTLRVFAASFSKGILMTTIDSDFAFSCSGVSSTQPLAGSPAVVSPAPGELYYVAVPTHPGVVGVEHMVGGVWEGTQLALPVY